MSHFTVLVIGENYESQLAPFHEFECTGTVDQYVVDVDETDDLLKSYRSSSVSCIILADGTRVGAYDDRFYREKTPEEKAAGNSFDSHRKVRIIALADDVRQVDVPCPEYGSIHEYIESEHGKRPLVRQGETLDFNKEHKWGYTLVDGNGGFLKTFRRTNPNRKWDWYKVGGRWTGFFPLKAGSAGKTGEPGRYQHVPVHLQQHGLMTKAAEAGTADQCRIVDIDYERAQDEAEAKARDSFGAWAVCLDGNPAPLTWTHFRESEADIESARTKYNAQPAIAAHKASGAFMMRCAVEVFGLDVEEYIQKQRLSALVPFAVVKDGIWHEKGSMGWWGCVSGEKDGADWNGKVAELFTGLPDDTQVTLVDCHI